MVRKLLGASALVGGMAIVGASVVFACTSIASVQNISPAAGPQGTHITMNFSGFNSMGSTMTNATTNVYFGGQAHGILVASAPTAQNFSVSFDAPAGLQPGNYLIEAVSTGYNSSTGQQSREVTRTVFDMTPGVASSSSSSQSSVSTQTVPGSSTQDQVQKITVDEGVSRTDGNQAPGKAATSFQTSPLPPGQAATLASQSAGSLAGLVLLIVGVAVLGTGIAAVGAVAVGRSRVAQPARQKAKQRI